MMNINCTILGIWGGRASIIWGTHFFTCKYPLGGTTNNSGKLLYVLVYEVSLCSFRTYPEEVGLCELCSRQLNNLAQRSGNSLFIPYCKLAHYFARGSCPVETETLWSFPCLRSVWWVLVAIRVQNQQSLSCICAIN